jgi:outer membrane protein assembly factor BamB
MNSALSMFAIFFALMIILCYAEAPVQSFFSVKTGGAIWGSPIFYRGKLMFASYDRNVHVVDAKTGSKIWSAMSDNSVRAGLALNLQSNSVVDATLSGAITMRDLNTGNVLWKHQRKSYTWTFTPICVGDFTFVPMRNDDLIVLSNKDGSELATLRQSSGVWSAPLIIRNSSRGNELQLLVTVTADASVVSTIFSSGTFVENSRWKYDVVPHATHYKQKLHAWIFGSPCLCLFDGTSVIVFGGNDRVVRAVDASSGKELWTSRVSGKISSAPVAVASPSAAITYPVVATESGDVVCLGTSGNIRWQFSLRQSIGSIVGPSVVGGVVVIGGTRGRLVGLDGASGRQLFQTDVANCNIRSSPGLLLEGATLTIAIGCDSGILQTLKVENVQFASSALAGFAKPSVLRDITRALTREAVSPQSVDVGPPQIVTPIAITAVLCAVSGLVLLWRRNHLRKTKS